MSDERGMNARCQLVYASRLRYQSLARLTSNHATRHLPRFPSQYYSTLPFHFPNLRRRQIQRTRTREAIHLWNLKRLNHALNRCVRAQPRGRQCPTRMNDMPHVDVPLVCPEAVPQTVEEARVRGAGLACAGVEAGWTHGVALHCVGEVDYGGKGV